MHHTKIIVSIATSCSMLALISCLVVLPKLYTTMLELRFEIEDGVKTFKAETDSAFIELIDIQMSVTPQVKPQPVGFESLFRPKRQNWSGLPVRFQLFNTILLKSIIVNITITGLLSM